MEIIFMDEALEDVDTIYDFLLEARVIQASEIIERVIESADQLKNFPQLGVKVHRSSHWGDVRDLYSGNYCLRYALFAENLYVLRVWHQKENERNQRSDE